jgi:hypothetical protein
VVEDGETVALINACLTSGRVRDLDGAALEALVESTEAVILRAVGATD